jgi:hypothetical protein
MNKADKKWLELMFEYEVCYHCGGDVEDHTVTRVNPLGVRQIECLKPATDNKEGK